MTALPIRSASKADPPASILPTRASDADAELVYDVEWRERWTGGDGRDREMVRSVRLGSADDVSAFVSERSPEAVGREFRVTATDRGREVGAVVVHAAMIGEWMDGVLPRPVVETSWEADERAGSERWRLYALIADALVQAMELRLAPRRRTRDLMRSARLLLIGS